MLVYGDPSYEEDLGVLVARLQTRVTELARASAAVSLDALRSVLIEAGQLEQAAQDASAIFAARDAARLGALCQTVTDWSAAAFYGAWTDGGAAPRRDSDVSALLRKAMSVLEKIGHVPSVRVTVKLPEGFSFYALYPERYAVAAQRWGADHADVAPRRGVVVGVRSIGTSLSALVKAVLEADGWQVSRLTARPTGHPLSREARLAATEIPEASWGLVVDEGPGQSGSSMAAVAEALAGAGVKRSRICFFPGHVGEPGGAASAEARAWWAQTPRSVASLDDLRWAGRSLTQSLAALTPGLCGSAEPVARVDDLGGGLWRRYCFNEPSEWPASCVPFERTKYRCVLRDGSSVLWKYEGLAAGPDGPQAEAAFRRQAARANQGWTTTPLGVAYGFVATLWVEGQPLSRADGAETAILAHMGRYVASVAGPPLSAEERTQAVRCLGEMLYWNTWEAHGEAAAKRTHRWAEAAEVWERKHASPTYGDGRLAPQEWLRTVSGSLVKADSEGHDADHTVVGRQSVAWDLAGAMVEWQLEEEAARPLLAAFEDAGGRTTPPNVLAFYCLAYAAFRLGQCRLSADMLAHDGEEQARLWSAADGYRAEVLRRLESPGIKMPVYE